MFEGTHGGEKMSDLLKLDLQAVVSCLTWTLGTGFSRSSKHS